MDSTSNTFTQAEKAQLWEFTFKQGIPPQQAIDQVPAQRPKIDEQEYICSTLQANAKTRPTAQLNSCVRSTVAQLLGDRGERWSCSLDAQL